MACRERSTSKSRNRLSPGTKVVAKARKGRKLTARAQDKVLRALNTAAKTEKPEAAYAMNDLFTYEGR